MKIIRILAAIYLGFLLAASSASAASLLKVVEYDVMVVFSGFAPQSAPLVPLVEQASVDFTAGAAQSLTLNASTKLVRISCSVRCAIKAETGASTVTTSNIPLAADVPEYFTAPTSNTATYKISVIAAP